MALACGRANATWYNENIANGSDIVMMDLRWPWWPSATYFANWNTGFNPKPNNLTFYAGIQSGLPDGPGQRPHPDEAMHQAFRPGNTWSLWGQTERGIPPRFIDVGTTLSMVNAYGGEGTSAFLASIPWPFIRNDRWYTMLSRVWQPPGGGDHAYCGRWIKDHADGRWHLVGVAWLPIPATSFHGNSGFIEPLTSPNAVRALHRRHGYMRKDGEWRRADTVSIDKTVYVAVDVLPEDDHEFVAIEYAQRPDLMPMRRKGPILDGTRRHDFTTRQAAQPVLDRPAVKQVKAESTGHQVAVSWEVPDTASPAIGYKIEVFADPACRGTPLAIREERLPSTRHAVLDVACASPVIRLTVFDVFDQAAEPVILGASPAASPATPLPDVATVPGLGYEVLHQDTRRRASFWNDPRIDPDERHHWLSLSELPQGKRMRQGWARGMDRSVLEDRSTGYAVRYEGRLRIPREGLYLFRARIDGAYRLQLNGTDVLLRDGQFGASQTAGIVMLAKGDQRLVVTHLFDSFPGLPAANFLVEWEGPGVPLQPIPIEALAVEADARQPTAAIEGHARGDGTAQVRVRVDPRARKIDKTTLFLGELELASAIGAGLEFQGALPAGTNRLWARILHDGSHTVDSEPFDLVNAGRPIAGPWTLRNAGDSRDTAGVWQTAEGTVEFFGHGMHMALARVTGDFTATMRVDSWSGSRGEPVHPASWVALAAVEHPGALNWNWGDHFYVAQTAGEGLRTSPDFGDGAGTRLSSHLLPASKPWLRVVRSGHAWMAWVSADGKDWELGGYQSRPMPAAMHAGLFIRALRQDSRAHFKARVSNLSITPGVAPGCELPTPPVANGTAGDRVTGVVMARSDSRVVVLRSSATGLIQSIDGGATWAMANGGLAGPDLVVRSVAIHPRRPEVMLRASGIGDGHGALWRTTNGGNAWTRLAFTGDFDGNGPSAICGEVVAFDPYQDGVLYAGTESRGFFRSQDDGATWQELKLEDGRSLAGQRITSVLAWPWHAFHPAQGNRPRICLTTAGDDWMPFLGRGTPGTRTREARTSRVIFSREDKFEALQVAHERPDTGIYNVINDMAVILLRGESRFATTHGLQSEYWGRSMAHYPASKNMEWLRPMTAMAATSMGPGNPRGRSIAHALDPAVPGRYSRSHAWAFEWDWLVPRGDVPRTGLLAVAGDERLGNVWWFVHSDGVYRSIDGGETLARVLDPTGRPVDDKKPGQPR